MFARVKIISLEDVVQTFMKLGGKIEELFSLLVGFIWYKL